MLTEKTRTQGTERRGQKDGESEWRMWGGGGVHIESYEYKPIMDHGAVVVLT